MHDDAKSANAVGKLQVRATPGGVIRSGGQRVEHVLDGELELETGGELQPPVENQLLLEAVRRSWDSIGSSNYSAKSVRVWFRRIPVGNSSGVTR